MRRPRDRRISTGKRLELQERDLIWFEKLNLHGPLPSSHLHAFTEQLPGCKDETRAIKRLGDLYHERTTAHGGPYLERSPQQFETMHARYQDVVSELTPHARAALREVGRHHAVYNEASRYSGPEREWKHRLMTACITASVELATARQPGCRFMHQDELLAQAPTTTRALPDPLRLPHRQSFFMPDHLFGIEYAGVGSRLIAVEAEKSRKTLETSDFARKSYERSFMQWREFIGSKQHRAHFGTDAGMVVLYVFSDHSLMQSAMHLLQAITEGRGNTFILFKALPEFNRNLRVPQPQLDLFHTPWQRAGRDPFALDRAL